jgi:hypothetical protein
VTFCGPEQRHDLKTIERLTRQSIEVSHTPANLDGAAVHMNSGGHSAEVADKPQRGGNRRPASAKPSRDRTPANHDSHHAAKPHHARSNKPRRGWQQRGRAAKSKPFSGRA